MPPDGSVPDISRWNRKRSILLVGDAKDTETPGNSATQQRLLGYLAWLATYASAPRGIAVLLICIRGRREAASWSEELNSLALMSGTRIGFPTASDFGPGLFVLRWSVRPLVGLIPLCASPISQ